MLGGGLRRGALCAATSLHRMDLGFRLTCLLRAPQMESAALRATTRRRVTGAQLPFCPRIIRLAQIHSVRALAGTSARLLARRSRPTGSCEELMVHR